MNYFKTSSHALRRAEAAAMGGLMDQLIGDLACVGFLFSPLAEAHTGLPPYVVGLLFILVPVPIGAALGWYKPPATARLFRWLIPLNVFGHHASPPDLGWTMNEPMYLGSRWVRSIGAGIVLALLYLVVDTLTRHDNVVTRLVAGLVTGIVSAVLIWRTLGKRRS